MPQKCNFTKFDTGSFYRLIVATHIGLVFLMVLLQLTAKIIYRGIGKNAFFCKCRNLGLFIKKNMGVKNAIFDQKRTIFGICRSSKG